MVRPAESPALISSSGSTACSLSFTSSPSTSASTRSNERLAGLEQIAAAGERVGEADRLELTGRIGKADEGESVAAAFERRSWR